MEPGTETVPDTSHHGQAPPDSAAVGRSVPHESRPVLDTLINRTADMGSPSKFLRALVQLGSKKAIPALIEVMSNADDPWVRHRAGTVLNKVVGTRIYDGAVDGDSGEPEGNFGESLKSFRRWWEKNGKNVKFDDKTGRWSVGQR